MSDGRKNPFCTTCLTHHFAFQPHASTINCPDITMFRPREGVREFGNRLTTVEVHGGTVWRKRLPLHSVTR